MTNSRTVIAMNLERLAVSQYDNYNFNSVCLHNGQLFGANDEGLFQLDIGDNDNGSEIDSFIETPTNDLGVPAPKRMRKAIMEMETSGSLQLKVTVDDRYEHAYSVDPKKTLQKQHRTFVKMGRNFGHGTYWMFRIENVNGCDFSVDSLYVVPIQLSLNRG